MLVAKCEIFKWMKLRAPCARAEFGWRDRVDLTRLRASVGCPL